MLFGTELFLAKIFNDRLYVDPEIYTDWFGRVDRAKKKQPAPQYVITNQKGGQHWLEWKTGQGQEFLPYPVWFADYYPSVQINLIDSRTVHLFLKNNSSLDAARMLSGYGSVGDSNYAYNNVSDTERAWGLRPRKVKHYCCVEISGLPDRDNDSGYLSCKFMLVDLGGNLMPYTLEQAGKLAPMLAHDIRMSIVIGIESPYLLAKNKSERTKGVIDAKFDKISLAGLAAKGQAFNERWMAAMVKANIAILEEGATYTWNRFNQYKWRSSLLQRVALTGDNIRGGNIEDNW